jgi:ABC-2 type transport system ATP-binding protein
VLVTGPLAEGARWAKRRTIGRVDAIVLRQLCKRFDGHTAVDELSLTVPQGSLFGFIGPNGSGKTTTLRMMVNILLPDSGEIVLLGERSTRSARDGVSYLPEERGLYRKMTVRRLLRYYGSLKGMPRAAIEEAIRTWLERFELTTWADRKIEALSKGMSQKVQFIATVLSSPRVLILDEPFSGLDPVNVEVLRDAIIDLRRAGTTIVFSTHDMAMAERMCDRIAMIFRGRKVLDGTLAEIQSAYGQGVVRVQTSGGVAVLAGLEEVIAVNDLGNLQEVRLRCDPQQFLLHLAARTTIQRFELGQPSLHDIFVRIARPDGRPQAVAHA